MKPRSNKSGKTLKKKHQTRHKKKNEKKTRKYTGGRRGQGRGRRRQVVQQRLIAEQLEDAMDKEDIERLKEIIPKAEKHDITIVDEAKKLLAELNERNAEKSRAAISNAEKINAEKSNAEKSNAEKSNAENSNANEGVQGSRGKNPPIVSNRVNGGKIDEGIRLGEDYKSEFPAELGFGAMVMLAAGIGVAAITGVF